MPNENSSKGSTDTSTTALATANLGKDINPKAISLESILKITSTIIAVGGLLLGIVTFKSQERYTQTQNFRIRLWERKLDVYTVLADIAGDIIVYRNDSTALDSLQDKFDKIYYSSLILVQNDSVEAKIRIYKDGLSDYRQGIKSIHYLKEKQIDLMRKIGIALKEKQDFAE